MKLPSFLQGGRSQPRLLVPNINLYPEDPFYASLIGKTLKWSVSVGRHIIIFTELVVIGSFATRFVLDRQLVDLNTSIVQRQSIVESYGTLEEDFRALQKKTADIQGILQQQGKFEVIERLQAVTPPEIRYDQISYTNNTLTLKGTALSNTALSQLVEALRRDPLLSALSISNIRGGDARDPAIFFSLNAQAGGAAAAESRSGSSAGATRDAQKSQTGDSAEELQ